MSSLPGRLAGFIRQAQAADGSFASQSVAEGQPLYGPGTRIHTTSFFTALILDALADVSDPSLDETRLKARDFLLSQIGEQASVNYWDRGSGEARSQPYPDDWDDTALTLAAVMRNWPASVDGGLIARIVTLLTNTEIREGGPYRTWLVTTDAAQPWQDVDLAVNSNIAYMLKLQEVELPNLERLADEHIEQRQVTSRYYPSPIPVLFFLSRWYNGTHRDWLRQELQRLMTKTDSDSNPLEVALIVLARLNLGAALQDVEPAIARLETWKFEQLILPYAYCFDPAVSGQAYVAGCGALTAALVLQCLTVSRPKATRARKAVLDEERANGIHDRVVTRVSQRMQTFETRTGGRELYAQWEHLRRRLLDSDPARQITLLPWLFARALGKNHQIISEQRLVHLGQLSLYGWLAYTIYDDFLDDEGRPATLPLANVGLRELAVGLAQEQGLARTAVAVIDEMEAANTWEVTHTRFRRQGELLTLRAPDFGAAERLADRSMGHALVSLAILSDLGFDAASAESRGVLTFFRHALAARQLSDEAHDWRPDLERGHINAVAAKLLDEVPQRGRSVAECYRRMETRFWEHTVRVVCNETLHQLSQARKALRDVAIITRPEVMEVMLSPIERAAHEALDGQQKMQEFLRAY